MIILMFYREVHVDRSRFVIFIFTAISFERIDAILTRNQFGRPDIFINFYYFAHSYIFPFFCVVRTSRSRRP